jgi:hypothetical protein
MTSQSEIEVAILQICNKLGMDAKLPSENQIIQAWRELAHDKLTKDSVVGKLWHEKRVSSVIIGGVRKFYKDRRKRESGKQ